MSLGLKIKSYKLIKFGGHKLDYYDGLLIKADKHLHDQMFAIVQEITKRLGIKKESLKILDIACGEGAFAKRLFDNGYTVDCLDIDEQSFKFKNLCEFYSIDINTQGFVEFAKLNEEKYDIVVSMETIEHIENSWSFLRGLRGLCKTGGYVVVSTPNVENPPSKVFFVRKNQFQSFTEKSFCEIGHINPLTEYEMRMISGQVGFEMVDVIGLGTHPIVWFTFDLKVCLPWTLSNIFFYPLSKRQDYSSCKAYLLKKKDLI